MSIQISLNFNLTQVLNEFAEEPPGWAEPTDWEPELIDQFLRGDVESIEVYDLNEEEALDLTLMSFKSGLESMIAEAPVSCINIYNGDQDWDDTSLLVQYACYQEERYA